MPEINSAITSHPLLITSMKRDNHQNTNAGLQRYSTNTAGQGASQTTYVVASHTFILALIAILGFCIPLKFPNGSPYATVHGTHLMNIFTIMMCTYIASLIVMASLASRGNIDLEDLMNKICLLLGALPVILELLVLSQPFGWFISFIWITCLVCFLCKYYQSLNNAVGQTLSNWNSRRRIRDDEADEMSISNDDEGRQT